MKKDIKQVLIIWTVALVSGVFAWGYINWELSQVAHESAVSTGTVTGN